MVYIYSHNRGDSLKALREALNCRVIASKNSKFKGSMKKTVINWGASQLPDEVLKCNLLNHPDAVAKAVDKRKTFEAFAQDKVECVPFTTDRAEAEAWIKMGKVVVARTVVNGHGGNGIVLIRNLDNMIDAPLYTQYIPKKEEYRIHVFKDEAFFIQRKARDLDVVDADVKWEIRNKANGFIFANKDIKVKYEAKALAVAAIKALGLDFGSVDMIYNQHRNQFFVLEVNTASGLMGSTLEAYTNKFKEFE